MQLTPIRDYWMAFVLKESKYFTLETFLIRISETFQRSISENVNTVIEICQEKKYYIKNIQNVNGTYLIIFKNEERKTTTILYGNNGEVYKIENDSEEDSNHE